MCRACVCTCGCVSSRKRQREPWTDQQRQKAPPFSRYPLGAILKTATRLLQRGCGNGALSSQYRGILGTTASGLPSAGFPLQSPQRPLCLLPPCSALAQRTMSLCIRGSGREPDSKRVPNGQEVVLLCRCATGNCGLKSSHSGREIQHADG